MSHNGDVRPAGNSIIPVYRSDFVANSDPVTYLQCVGDDMAYADKPMVIEAARPLIVNGQHWLTVLCTPNQLEYFTLGFLYNEGLIAGVDDVLDLQIGPAPEEVIRVELRDRHVDLPKRRTLTSGCGGGVTFVDLAVARERVESRLQVSPPQIAELMAHMVALAGPDHRLIGGFHTSAVSSGEQLLAVATDIGRHNTLDKVAGECLARCIPLHDTILLTTGRVSTEMLGKAARMQAAVVATVNSPTFLAAELARAWGITLIGYVRGRTMQVYSGWQRIESGNNRFAQPQVN